MCPGFTAYRTPLQDIRIMKLAVILLLAVCAVLLNTGIHGQAVGVGGGVVGLGRWNSCLYVRCRLGSRCIQRRWRAVCVPYLPHRRACFQPVNPGPCRAAFRRYFYNRFTGRCQRFIYGGCGGNLNNFYSWRQCQRRCVWRRNWPITPISPVSPIWPITPILYSSDVSSDS